MTDLLLWLALLPFIFGSLFCCGQLALLVSLGYNPIDTSSRIRADYMPWGYDLIPAINFAALIEDIQRDNRAMGNTAEPEVIVRGTFWAPPTPTAISIAQITETPIIFPTWTITQTEPPPNSGTPTPGLPLTPSSTATVAASITPSLTPSLTPSPTRTRTNTLFIPSSTNTQQPPPPPSPTPTRTRVNPTSTKTRTLAPVPTATFTRTPTPTKTPVTPSPTPVVVDTPVPEDTPTPVPTDTPVPEDTPIPSDTPEPPPTATYAPIIPLVENDGNSEPVDGGCRAYFGYWNQNPQAITIPLGARNYLSEENVSVSPEQPTNFVVGQISGDEGFSVEWTSGESFGWSLDGRWATARWCNP